MISGFRVAGRGALIVFIAFALLSATAVFAWTGAPSGTPPNCPAGYAGCDAPLNVGSTGQFKLGNLGITGYLNFSSTLGTGGYGIRDNSGTIEFKNSGGSWASIGSGGSGSGGTSSPYPPFPDTIKCTDGGGNVIIMRMFVAGPMVEYRWFTYSGNVAAGAYGVVFNQDGSYNSSNLSGWDCLNKSITQLTTEGKTAFWGTGGSGQWTTSGTSIYYNTGNVGINKSSPSQKLDVGGNVTATDYYDQTRAAWVSTFGRLGGQFWVAFPIFAYGDSSTPFYGGPVSCPSGSIMAGYDQEMQVGRQSYILCQWINQ